jgi:regulator of replication initiation timing
METQVYKTREYVENISSTINDLIEENQRVLDSEVTSFVKSYLHALQFEFESAVNDGEYAQLEDISQDLRDLLDRTYLKLGERRTGQASTSFLVS